MEYVLTCVWPKVYRHQCTPQCCTLAGHIASPCMQKWCNSSLQKIGCSQEFRFLPLGLLSALGQPAIYGGCHVRWVTKGLDTMGAVVLQL